MVAQIQDSGQSISATVSSGTLTGAFGIITNNNPGRLIVFATATPVPAKTVSTVTVSNGTCTATLVGAKSGTAIRVEIWLIRNHTSTDATPTFTITYSQTTGACGICARALDMTTDWAAAGATITASAGGTGTSTAADTALVTPAVGDLLLSAAGWAQNTSSTARTHTGNSFYYTAASSVGFTGGRVELGWGQSVNTTATKEVFTNPNVEWAAIAATLLPPADRAAIAAKVYKWRLTALQDASAVA